MEKSWLIQGSPGSNFEYFLDKLFPIKVENIAFTQSPLQNFSRIDTGL